MAKKTGSAKFINTKRPWKPAEGTEFRKLISSKKLLSEEERETLREKTLSILGRCVQPGIQTAAHNTGLVVGYVQSGKTLSFTALAAIARDNDFPLIIVVSGTSTNLVNQSEDRLKTDLQVATSSGPWKPWHLLKNPGEDTGTIDLLTKGFAPWRSKMGNPKARRTFMIVVSKQWQRLKNLTELLSALDLKGITALVIDDEADQASMNTRVKQGDQSTTYAELLSLRNALPRHSFVQYTATPQATLLINIIDALSPKFVEVLSPGTDYVGGQEFFDPSNTRLVVEIPDNELPDPDRPPTSPPPSLLRAMRLFHIGVADAFAKGEGPSNRSMLVHPSEKRDLHLAFERLVQGVSSRWLTILGSGSAKDKSALLSAFKTDYTALKIGNRSLSSWSAIKDNLLDSLRNPLIKEINARSGKTPKINWESNYSFILVGGQAMDRGFTVEGLTVTYMPRGAGVRNADTIQQRARFFGYKRAYLSLCRVFLERDVKNNFAQYVLHEEHLRGSLDKITRSGDSLDNWKRAFFLNRSLQLTRTSVIGFEIIKGNFSGKWFRQDYAFPGDASVNANNLSLTNALNRWGKWKQFYFKDYQTKIDHQIMDGLDFKKVMTEFLVPWRFGDSEDSNHSTGLLLQLSHYLESNPHAKCAIVKMAAGKTRLRSLSGGYVDQLFQGASAANYGKNATNRYPGDAKVHMPNRITIQVHMVADKDGSAKKVAPMITVWVPKGFGEDFQLLRT